MKNYKKLLLDKLIDSYENSVIYKGDALRDTQIYFKFNLKSIKEYFDELNYKYKEEIDVACNQLEIEKLIKVYKGKGYKSHIIDKIQLNLENIEAAYLYLNRKEKKQKEDEVSLLLESYKEREDVLGNFAKYITDRLKSNGSVKKYLDIENSSECKDILKGIDEVLKQDDEIFRRNFSVKVYGDSKRYEAIESKVIKIINEFSNDEFLNDYNILKNYTYVYFKGDINLKLKESKINANDFLGGIAVSSKDIENIKEIKVLGNKLVTIENLTSFNNYNGDGGVIYLGGYHNSVRQNLLIKIYSENPHISYYHSGDIDVGGFKILVHLIKKTKIPFKTLNMDSETLLKNIDYAKSLTVNDVSEITGLLENKEYKDYSNVLSTMIKLDRKLEQEIVF
ncbi:Wadjet anti-phage system protein JetD domain-containing protein [Clostridium chromiireducens]|uniref:Wadjet anti-phage system protein JetD domain-containing protein n=1 Tax=Clostridium chromiireducens TaxID=225345 RepID=UPI003AF7327C